MPQPPSDLPAKIAHLRRWRTQLDDPPVEVDFGLSGLDDAALQTLSPALARAHEAMAALEGGAIANRDEQRMVGHYWLRAPGRAPAREIGDAIAATLRRIEEFAAKVHSGHLSPPEGGAFSKVLLIGIGGSALGPMLAADALAAQDAPMRLWVLDNTDPDGIDRTLADVGSLVDTLVLVVSKSGGTPETRNGMLETMRACAEQGVAFATRAVAVTTEGSALHRRASDDGWLATFPMWDWVGGRTSITSAVGLLPMALIGLDLRGFLAGAAAMDDATRDAEVRHNPAALLAAWWHVEGGGRGDRAMVVLPYKDRLLLTSRYLQQLVMESLGKQLDRGGREVDQGLTVYGNKGSTDQHAFVQQLRDGRHDFFAVFVRTLSGRAGTSASVHEDDPEGPTAGDYLDGFLLGTRRALAERGRRSVTITLGRSDERNLGALLALFERAVGLYGELIDVNAYHQPGVEAGKKAAAAMVELQQRALAELGGEPLAFAELCRRLGGEPAEVWATLQHLAHQHPQVKRIGAPDPDTATFVRLG